MTIRIAGQYTFQLPVEVVYEALRDEALIRHALPGRVRFQMTTPTHYEAEMSLDIPRFHGHYAGSLDVVDTEPNRFYRLEARGTGRERYVEAAGLVTLTPVGPNETQVSYEGWTDAFDDLNRLILLAAPPVVVQLANRGLHHLEQVIHAQRERRP